MENIWDYIDDNLSPEAAEKLKQQLKGDPKLLEEWQLRYQLDQALSNQELDQPSMRFSQNVMDKLPDLYGKQEIKPLVNKYGIRVFWATFSLSLVGLFIFLGNNAAENTARERVQNLTESLLSLPLEFMMVTAAVSLGFVLLYLIDRQLKKRLSVEL